MRPDTGRQSRVPFFVALCVILFVIMIQLVTDLGGGTNVFKQLEALTYDWRLQMTVDRNVLTEHSPITGVFIDDGDVRDLNSGALGYQYIFPWPRSIYGRILRELSAQGAEAVAFDILFPERRPDRIDEMEPGPNGEGMFADEFFATQIAAAGNVVLATEGRTLPTELFKTNAWNMGSVYSKPDYNVLRRVKPFQDVTNRVWHSEIAAMASALSFDLERPIASEDGSISFLLNQVDGSTDEWTVPLKPNGMIDFEAWDGDARETEEAPYVDEVSRAWHLGIVLASRVLEIDLEKTEVSEKALRFFSDTACVRTIPLDRDGYFYIDWSVLWDDLKKSKVAIRDLLIQDHARLQGQKDLGNPFKDKLVIIGSVATGNNLTDQGATPLEETSMLVTKHLNVADSLINHRFIQPYGYPMHLSMILLLGGISAVLTWRLRAVFAATSVFVALIVYVSISLLLMDAMGYWLPIALPVGGSLLMTHISMVTYRVVVEQRETRRVRSAFSSLVAPDVVNEVLKSEVQQVGGKRMEMTVLFADVRGFTSMTDSLQASARDYVEAHGLKDHKADAIYNEHAGLALDTVNFYLGTIANVVKKHRGTLDKYMGDCVMAFWGAPVDDPQHALHSVQAAMEAQTILHAANENRRMENIRRKAENGVRARTGLYPIPELPVLTLGTGINTGFMTVGFMGSSEHIRNYTVFGREVNLASRLEGVSGSGRIVVGSSTFKHLEESDPMLASRCQSLPSVHVKGIEAEVEIFEVPWRVSKDV